MARQRGVPERTYAEGYGRIRHGAARQGEILHAQQAAIRRALSLETARPWGAGVLVEAAIHVDEDRRMVVVGEEGQVRKAVGVLEAVRVD